MERRRKEECVWLIVWCWYNGILAVWCCLACGSFDRLCGVVWPVAVLIGCVVLSGLWQF